jgi:hypothetical protein
MILESRHESLSGSSGVRSGRNSSSASLTGDEMTYSPLAQLPRSMVRQRALQKGKSPSVLLTSFLQMGQRNFAVDMGFSIVEGTVNTGRREKSRFFGCRRFRSGCARNDKLFLLAK